MFLSIGNINFDYLIFTEEPPVIDGRIEARNFVIESGGSACNFAVTITKLGGKCGVFGCVGRDGDWLIKRLKEKKVEASEIIKVAERESGKVFVIVDLKGHRTMIAYKGANELLKPEFIKKLNLEKYVHVHVSSREPCFINEIYMRIGDKHNITLSYDPGWTIVKRESGEILNILDKLDFLLMNRREFGYFIKTNNITDITKLFSKFQKLKFILVKEGEKGAKAIHGKKIINVPAFKVSVVDTTGAGDVFNAATIFSLKNGFSIKEALIVGNAAAAFKITKVGAQAAPSTMELCNFLKERGFERIALKIQNWRLGND